MLTALAMASKPRLLGRWLQIAILLGCVLLTGCTQPGILGDRFADDDLSRMSRKVRPADPDVEPGGLSGRSRQIEADLGVR